MKLLIHTQYFPPEVGAPQNRLYELALRLQALGVDVTVLTAMPNYPKMEIHPKYKEKSYVAENMEGLKVHRSSIYVSASKSIFKRLLNYFSFVWSSYWIGRSKLEKQYDLVLCESPPLFLGISSYLLAKRKGARFIFNVSDLWPESAEKLGLVTNRFFLKLAQNLEESLYKKASLITGQTQGIVQNIKSRFPQKEVYWLPNGVDLNFYDPDKIQSNWREENNFTSSDKLFLYAGIIGHAQGLEIILKAAKILETEKNLHFLILGSGPCKKDLLKKADSLNLKNLRFLETVDKQKMPEIIKAVDVALIPLKKLDLFKGAIPSKIFENLAMKVPLLLGVEGEAKKLFIDEGDAGLFYEPENEKAMVKAVQKILENPELIDQMGKNGRKYVMQKFNRNSLAESFFEKLKGLK
ncbi:MAG: glycosyltransferase family 4 protein [Vicingaceae bacterium]